MSADTPSVEAPRERRSSLLYALGKLTAETTEHRRQLDALTKAQAEVPSQVAALLQPQFAVHDKRISKLEVRADASDRWRYGIVGGLVVVVTGVGWILEVLKVPVGVHIL